MNDCLFKPMGLKALTALLAGWQAPLGGNAVSGNDVQLYADQASITARLHELTGGDSEAIAVLIHEALHCSEKDLAELRDLLARHDTPGVAALAHRIRGQRCSWTTRLLSNTAKCWNRPAVRWWWCLNMCFTAPGYLNKHRKNW